ncbi:hypothetical protein [Nocardioides sp.]|uniref:hypothetical protein n=1 Tax=Nocardioides sp. TaxID=35761 RepID=UPI003783A37F
MKRTALVALALAGLLGTAACSGSDSGGSSDGGSGSGGSGTSATPYLPVPDGVELTEQGSQLSVGDHAVVAYHPRQDQVGVLDLQVTELQKASVKDLSAWQLSPEQKASTPYYVRATVKNVGDTDLGGRPVPLYVVNEKNVLLEATPFASSFEPCPSTPLPDKFPTGASTKACLVYLAPDHGQLTAVSFRPDESFNPITWTGDVVPYEAPKPPKPSKSGKAKNSKKGNGQ